MGLYVNQDFEGKFIGDSAEQKFQALIKAGGKEISQPQSVAEFSPDLVCVIDNLIWGAAAYIKSPTELSYFIGSQDPRPKRWLLLPGVEKIAR